MCVSRPFQVKLPYEKIREQNWRGRGFILHLGLDIAPGIDGLGSWHSHNLFVAVLLISKPALISWIRSVKVNKHIEYLFQRVGMNLSEANCVAIDELTSLARRLLVAELRRSRQYRPRNRGDTGFDGIQSSEGVEELLGILQRTIVLHARY